MRKFCVHFCTLRTSITLAARAFHASHSSTGENNQGQPGFNGNDLSASELVGAI